MHPDKSQTLYYTSIIGRCGKRNYKGQVCPYWRDFQEMEIIFISNKHFVWSMKKICRIIRKLRFLAFKITNMLEGSNLNSKMRKWFLKF